MQRTTLPKLAIIAGVLVVGIAVGLGAWLQPALLPGEDRPVTVGAYEVSQSDFGVTEIAVWVTAGSGAIFTLFAVEQKPDRVEISVRVRGRPGAPRTLEAVPYRLTWPLNGPLGSRIVVDTSTGNDVPPLK